MLVDLEGEGEVELEIVCENLPCYICLSSGHPFNKCPSSVYGKEKSAAHSMPIGSAPVGSVSTTPFTDPSPSCPADQVNQIPNGSVSVAPGYSSFMSQKKKKKSVAPGSLPTDHIPSPLMP